MADAIAASGRSMRDISLSAGMAAGYVHSIVYDDREPGMERMMKIADDLGVSLTHILFGVDMTGDTEQLLRLYATLSPDQKAAFQSLAKSMSRESTK